MTARTPITEDDKFVCLIGEARNYCTIVEVMIQALTTPKRRIKEFEQAGGFYLGLITTEDEIDALTYACGKATEASRGLSMSLDECFRIEETEIEQAVES